jgi:dihydropyrimidinase
MDYDLVIKNGVIVTALSTYRADVAIKNEKIVAIGSQLAGGTEIDAVGKYVIPGAVDIHVHMQLELGGDLTSSDSFYTGTRAAAFGGTTAIVDFIDPKPDESLVNALASRRKLADPEVVIDYGLHMTLGPSEIAKLDQVVEAYQAGCSTFKLYMAYGYRLDDGQLLQALDAVGTAGGLSVVHAENWDAITTLIEKNIIKGRTSPKWHPKSRPSILEGESTGRVIDLAAYVGAPIHIFHVSCEETMLRIKTARQNGLPVTGETCPQYLFLGTDVYDKAGLPGALPVCSPPLRSKSDQTALWQALADGHLQIVTTDHCPFTLAQKELGWKKDFSQIPGGVPSVEMRLAAIYSGGVCSGILSLNQWVDICCTSPARIAGFQSKGDITIGYDADLVVFDPKKLVTLSEEFLHENVDWTPYQGTSVQGWPEVTISRGRIVVAGDKFRGEAGWGSFVNRSLPGS